MKKSGRFCPQITTAQIGLTTQERQNQVEKKNKKVLPSDNNSPNRTTTQERQNQMKKEGKVLPLDNDSPNRTDYPRETTR